MISAFGIEHGPVSKLYTEHRPSTAAEIAEAGYKDPKRPEKISVKDMAMGAGIGAGAGTVIAGLRRGALPGAILGAGAGLGLAAAGYNKRKANYDKKMANPISTMRTDEWVKGQKPYVDRFPADGKGYLSKPVKRFSREVGGE